uniref:CBFD_NFYB_HMF domain-containing protein n=1 Tax=Macrostomum lignano TaxID=282301 RepID=A0A1I8F1J2_9PLAT
SMSAEPDADPIETETETSKEDTPFEAAQRIDEDDNQQCEAMDIETGQKLVEDEEEPESEPVILAETEKENEVVKLSSLPQDEANYESRSDTRLINKEAVLAVTKATELFIQQLGKAAHDFAVKSKRKTVTKKDVELAINWHPVFSFLDAGTGKSCLLHQFLERKFKADSSHTIGVEFGSKVIDVNGRTVKLQVMLRAIWDTAGQERFKSVTRSYYRGAAGALLVYDVTSRDSYNALSNWLSDARSLASPNIAIVMIGNKRDLDADREVTLMEASQFAQQNCLLFLETSAKTGENVEDAFGHCARAILSKIESGEVDPERLGSGVQFTAGSFSGRSRSLGGGGGGTGDHGGGPLDN